MKTKLFVALMLVTVLSLVMMTTASAAQPTNVHVYSGGSITTPAGAWTGSGALYPDSFNLTAGDLTLYVQDVDMRNARSQNWSCPYTSLPDPTFQAGLQFGITNRSSLGSIINPRTSAWQNILSPESTSSGQGYYLGQQWYTDASSQFQGPSLGWNTPFQGPSPNGGYHCTSDPEYDRFDLKIVYQNLGAGSGFRVYAYQRVHKTTDPFANAVNQWFPMYDAPGYQDVPEAAMTKTAVKPFIFVSNWGVAAGGGTISWGKVVAVTAPPTLALAPVERRIAVGASTTVLVDLTSISNLFGYQFQVHYDSTKVSATAAFVNSFFDTTTNAYPVWNANCTTPGACKFSVTKQGSGTPQYSGWGTLAKITFTGTSPGVVPLTFSDDILSDRNGSPITHNTMEATLIVTGNATIGGTVALQGRTAPYDAPATTVTLTDSLGVFLPTTVHPDASGVFTATVPVDPGGSTYALLAAHSLYLSNQFTGLAVTDEGTFSPTPSATTLRGGDANNDGKIDIADLSCTGGDFGTSNNTCTGGNSDINGDGTVNILDLVLEGGNYGLNTPLPW